MKYRQVDALLNDKFMIQTVKEKKKEGRHGNPTRTCRVPPAPAPVLTGKSRINWVRVRVRGKPVDLIRGRGYSHPPHTHPRTRIWELSFNIVLNGFNPSIFKLNVTLNF